MIKGKCLCGAVEFEVSGKPKQINLCHCKMCQKFSGSAFGAFMRVQTSDYKLTQGEERVYDSSEWAARAFCPNCGASTRYINKEAPEYTFVAAGCLDDDPTIKPRHHIFVKDKAVWYDFDADIPRFSDWKSSVPNNVS